MSAGVPADARAVAAENLLGREGLPGVRVSVAGHQREIAVVEAEPAALVRLAELAPEIKALGFRFVTIDLAPPR
ncbi:MAG: hypothetical protein IRZ00_03880 [Gemmatimonadetes bacterium]|nr:hypothetical protein [Gemmatimonadota bacterium]